MFHELTIHIQPPAPWEVTIPGGLLWYCAGAISMLVVLILFSWWANRQEARRQKQVRPAVVTEVSPEQIAFIAQQLRTEDSAPPIPEKK